MITLLDREVRRKWHQIQWRVNNQRSYINRHITNDFDSYEQFRTHALSKGFQKGYHCHRPNRNRPYSIDNLEFIDAETHAIISAYEKRKLTDNQVRLIRNMYKSGEVSQRKLAKQFSVSQTCIQKIVTRKSYKNVR